MKKKVTAYLLLGSNIGNRLSYIESSIEQLSKYCKIANTSSIYETAAWGVEDQQDYLNAVVEIEFDKSAEILHTITRGIESELGRIDKGNFLPRTIDIDILFFADKIITTETLSIPHPRLQNRLFTLVPLAEIAFLWKHPKLKKYIYELLLDCDDQLPVHLFSNSKTNINEV